MVVGGLMLHHYRGGWIDVHHYLINYQSCGPAIVAQGKAKSWVAGLSLANFHGSQALTLSLMARCSLRSHKEGARGASLKVGTGPQIMAA